jgi:cytochrome c oxidase assembly factor CtaG
MPPLLHVHATPWDLPLMFTATMAAVAWVYLRGWIHIRRADVSLIPAWRAGGFLVGLLMIWTAVASPLASCDAGRLTVHMVQHLLLMTFAPPLIFLAAPVIALGHGLPRFLQSSLGRFFSLRPVRRLGSALVAPVFCWIAATATLMSWHVPALFTMALHSRALHAIEHVSFLGTGLLFWWPVIQPWPSVGMHPRWGTVLYLFLATLPCDILSAFLVFSDRIAYPVYLSAPGSSLLSVAEDQQSAGALMWTCVTLVYLAAGMVLSTRLLAMPSEPLHTENL